MRIYRFLAVLLLCCSAVASSLVRTRPDGTVRAPSNFWVANSNSINAVVVAGGGVYLAGTNIVLSGTGPYYINLNPYLSELTATNLNLINPVTVPNGGIGVSNLTAGALVMGSGTNPVQSLTGTAGDLAYYGPNGWTNLNKSATVGHVLKQGSSYPEWGAASGSSPTTTRGDLIYRAASADDRLAVGKVGSPLISDGTDPIWGDMSAVSRFDEDWLGYSSAGSYAWTATSVGTAAGASGTGAEAGRNGLISITGGTATSLGSCWLKVRDSSVVLGSGTCSVRFAIKTPTALSDATENYVLFAGLSDGVTTNQVGALDSVGFVYNQNTNTAKWEAVCMSNGSITVADTGLTVVQATWYTLGFDVNADASLVTFYTNNVAACTINATIPTGTARALGPALAVMRNVYTSVDRLMLVDWFKYLYKYTTAR